MVMDLTDPVIVRPPEKCSDSSALARKLFWISLVTFFIVKSWLSWGRYLNQDEFESLHQGWLLYSGATQYKDFNSNHPPVAFALLGTLNYFTEDTVTLILLARLLTFVSAGGTLWLLFHIGRSVYNSNAAYWTVILLAFNATFLEWSTEVRTDFVMIPLWLAAVGIAVQRQPRSVVRQMISIGLLMGTAFWVNQKVVFHALPLGIFILLGGPDRRWRFRDVGVAVLASLLPAVIMFGHAWLEGALLDLIRHNFGGAWGLVQEAPYAAVRWRTAANVVIRDPGFVRLVAASLFAAFGVGENRRSHLFLVGTALWMAFSFFLTPGPFPYYMLHVFPLFAVITGGWIDRIQTDPSRGAQGTPRWGGNRLVVYVALLAVFPVIRMAKFVYPTITNQFRVIMVASQLTTPETRVFDGAGALIRRPDAYPFHWVLWASEINKLHAGQLPPLIPTLRENECRLVIETYRVHSLPLSDRQVLNQQFVRLWGPLRVPGYDSLTPINSDKQTFELWYNGVYKSNKPELIIDGLPMEKPRFLEAGWHSMQLPGTSGRVQLMEVGVSQGIELPEEIDPLTFLGMYGYGY